MSTTADAVRVASPTEARNPRTTGIDQLGTLEVVRALHAEDARVPEAVAAALPQLAEAVDLIAVSYTHLTLPTIYSV